jgi:hypothetical protein
MISKEFVLAGRAVFTIEVPEAFVAKHGTKPHYTFKVVKKEGTPRYPRDTWFVNLLTGPQNTRDYTYLGLLDVESGQVRLTAKSKYAHDSLILRMLNRVLALIWLADVNTDELENQHEVIKSTGFDVHHEGRCGMCGRPLTTPESVKTGIGPICDGRL